MVGSGEDSWLEMAYEDRNGAVQDDYLDDFEPQTVEWDDAEAEDLE